MLPKYSKYWAIGFQEKICRKISSCDGSFPSRPTGQYRFNRRPKSLLTPDACQSVSLAESNLELNVATCSLFSVYRKLKSVKIINNVTWIYKCNRPFSRERSQDQLVVKLLYHVRRLKVSRIGNKIVKQAQLKKHDSWIVINGSSKILNC